MKKSPFVFLILLFAWSCQQIEPDLTGIGEVTFKSVSIESFSGNLPNGRIAGPSSWKHIFNPEETLEITNKVTGETYSLEYNPNDFGDGFSIPLPYGSYSYYSEGEGEGEDGLSRYLPFRVEGEFNLSNSILEISLSGSTDHALITLKNEYVKEVNVILEEMWAYQMNLLEDETYYYIYAKKDLNVVLRITEVFDEKTIERQIHTQPNTHYNFFLKLVPGNGNVNFIELAIGEFESIDRYLEIGESNSETFTDPRDGQVYKIVKIGNQVWMAENMNYETENSSCLFDDPANCEKYGRLYRIFDREEFCPKGWHVPNNEEWKILFDYLGGDNVAGGKMKSITGWPEPNFGATNESGFNGLPSALSRSYENPPNELIGRWWSSSIKEFWDGDVVYTWITLRSEFASVRTAGGEDNDGKYSCRCVKD